MEEITRQLPGHNCGACGYARCDQFAEALTQDKTDISTCKALQQERYRGNRERIAGILEAMSIREGVPAERPTPGASDASGPVGLIDGYRADFTLLPLPGEAACREILLSITPGEVEAGQVIRYRPLGCPITHFARIILKRDGLLTVHVVGPRHRLGDAEFRFTDVGVCMVIGFEGTVEGKQPSVGETVRFEPSECMMRKVHSGVVVKSEGRTVLLEGIDLKVWAPPVKG
jgi:uncharacterized Fe-S cluster-containing protein